MHVYTYRWSVRPGNGMAVELCVTASSAVTARREVRRFLVDHDGTDWAIDGVSRETGSGSRPPLYGPLPGTRKLRS